MLAVLLCVYNQRYQAKFTSDTTPYYSFKHCKFRSEADHLNVFSTSIKNKDLHLRDDQFLTDHIVYTRILRFASDGNFTLFMLITSVCFVGI
jgi:hypothetical protein